MTPHHTRRHFLRALAAAGLTPVGAHAAEESASLDILVDKGKWGSASQADIRAVTLSAAGELWKHCPGQRIKPIRIYHRSDYPQTDFRHDWRGRVRIGLASQDTRWAQMAFQFSHEFCHALAQHSSAARRAWRTPRHANLWFEESLCEAASLFTLQRLSATWAAHPPYPQWRDYAPAFAAYADERLARAEHQPPTDRTFTAWFSANQTSLRENPAQRAKNVIIARQFLPLFNAAPEHWDAACYLNLGRHDRDKPFAQYLAEWQANSPPEHREFLRRLSALFPPG